MRKVGFSALVAAFVCSVAAVPVAHAVSEAVSFAVVNRNDSDLPCLSDGAALTVRGHLVMPDTPPPGVTLYLHGLGFGEWFWNFSAVTGYDYAAQMAALGHASVIIDRVGYGDSGAPSPDGFAGCVGAQATVAHQIVEQLRSGSYTVVGGGPAQAFSTVALAGHSAGGAIAQVEAYSKKLGDIDALVVMSYADQGASNATLETFAESGVVCLTGGEGAQDPRGPLPATPLGGYAYFGQTPSDFTALMFNTGEAGQPTATPDVIATAAAMQSRDPCGDLGSIAPSILLANLFLANINKPVYVVCGDRDAIFPPPACDEQKAHFTGAPVVGEKIVTGAGHALTLGTNAADFRDAMSLWLAANGL